MSQQRYAITGMTCQGCVKRVTAALAPFAGSVSVSLRPPQASLTDPNVDFNHLQSALAGTHYGIHALTDNAPEAQSPAMREEAPTSATTPERSAPPPDATPSWLMTYRPLLLILAYIVAGSVFVQIPTGAVSTDETMRYFMAGFFLVFSFFKMLDVGSFADAYAGYDLLAQRWRAWGLIYPWVELALGLAYLVRWQPVWTNLATLVVMGFSAIGVLRAVWGQEKIRCACLGTVFQLPMSTVTIIEDIGMAAMAGLMLIQAR